MSYFDHVRCHGCKATLDPESLAPGRCPKCGVELSLKDLFGLSAAFAEEDENDVTLDHLVSAPRPAPSAAPPGSALEAMRGLKRR